MVIQIAMKKKQNDWRGALIVDGTFQDSFNGMELRSLVEAQWASLLDSTYPEGQEVTVTITINPQKSNGSE